MKCKWPKETVSKKFRKQNTVFMDEGFTKQIIYPKELCYQEVKPDDIVENMIININILLPGWTEIKVDKIDNKLPKF
jgi:hypothetical protein